MQSFDSMHPMVLSQKVGELSKERAVLKGELDAAREEGVAVKRQLQEAMENVGVLEEGQSFLLEKHKQVVSDYHSKLKKTKEDQKALLQQNEALTHHTHQLQEALTQYQTMNPPNDPSAKVEVAQLLTVIEDLQKAIDEKNELIDLLSAQVTQLQQVGAASRARHEEMELDLSRARQELDFNRRATVDTQKPMMDSLQAYITHRDSVRDGEMAKLSETVNALRVREEVPPPYVSANTSFEVPTMNLSGVSSIPLYSAVNFSGGGGGVGVGSPITVPLPAPPKPPPSILSLVSQRGGGHPPLSPSTSARSRAIFSPPKPV